MERKESGGVTLSLGPLSFVLFAVKEGERQTKIRKDKQRYRERVCVRMHVCAHTCVCVCVCVHARMCVCTNV